LDLIENGRLLAATDARDDLHRPSGDELVITGAEFALDFLAGVRGAGGPPNEGLGSMQRAEEVAGQEIRSPQLLLAGGMRRVIKLVLFPVRFLFTAATGRVGTNDAAVTPSWPARTRSGATALFADPTASRPRSSQTDNH
jgi:hypothetical protein